MTGADDTIRYAGFWIRVAAGLIDSMLFSVLLVPALISIYGIDWLLGDYPVFKIHGVWEVLLTYVLPAFVSVVFWIYKSATPGKMITKIKIINADTGMKLSIGQCIVRYLAYFPAMLFGLLGVIWVAFDRRKQGWHDKLARTLVVEVRPHQAETLPRPRQLQGPSLAD